MSECWARSVWCFGIAAHITCTVLSLRFNGLSRIRGFPKNEGSFKLFTRGLYTKIYVSCGRQGDLHLAVRIKGLGCFGSRVWSLGVGRIGGFRV